jgi:hypothetical protein
LDPLLNKLESTSLFVALVTIAGGAALLDGDVGDASKQFVTVMLLLVNSVFLFTVVCLLVRGAALHEGTRAQAAMSRFFELAGIAAVRSKTTGGRRCSKPTPEETELSKQGVGPLVLSSKSRVPKQRKAYAPQDSGSGKRDLTQTLASTTNADLVTMSETALCDPDMVQNPISSPGKAQQHSRGVQRNVLRKQVDSGEV